MSKIALGDTEISGVLSVSGLDTGGLSRGEALLGDGFGGVPSFALFNEETVFDEVKLTGEAAGDNFGSSVAIGPNRIVVGAMEESSVGASSGAVYVYDLSRSLITKLTGEAAGDKFGEFIDVNSERIVVGARYESSVGNESGAAYIYDLDGNLITKLTGAAADDQFGNGVSVGPNRVVVGAAREDTNGSDAGAAYIYDLDGTLITKLIGADLSSFFGSSVEVGNNKILVGAPTDPSGATVYVYDLNGNQIDTLTGAAGNNAFGGSSISIGATRIVVGEELDSTNNSFAGSAVIFDLNGNQIKQVLGEDSFGFFGLRTSVGSGCVVVGSESNLIDIYDLNGNLLKKIIGASGSSFGQAVAINFGRLVVGAKTDDSNGTDSGAVYFYQTPVLIGK